jgi:hypothetical protein
MGASSKNVSAQKKKEFLAALIECKGIITHACEQVGISRGAVYKWEKDEEFRQAKKEAEEKLCDFYEKAFVDLVAEKNPNVTTQAAKTKLRKRGYGDKVEVSGTLGIDPYEGMTVEEIVKRRKALESEMEGE